MQTLCRGPKESAKFTKSIKNQLFGFVAVTKWNHPAITEHGK